MQTFSLSNAPAAVTKLYDRALRESLDAGNPRDIAERKAIRHTQHAGWYRSAKGWKQLTPDLRDKVNVRDAVEQPDGTFVVQDVDVFYPNSVKGSGESYTAEDIAQMSANTNRSIAAGGQKPGLTEGHPHILQAAGGTQLDTFGAAINFRASSKGKGWARCDLVDVKPDVIERLKQRKLTGLSVGIVKDGGGLNRRFGHVAMLGGSSQALSRLPALEIFSVPTQVCFSAETPTDAFKKGLVMNDKQKMAFSALSTAYAAFAAGEPGCEDKLKEAREMYSAAFEGESEGEMPPAMPEGKAKTPEAVVPAPTEADGAEFSIPDESTFAADPAGAFAVMRGTVAKLVTQQTNDRKLVNVLKLQNAGLLGKQMRSEFDATLADLKREGHQLPDDTNIGQMFQTCFSSSEPTKAIATLTAFLKGTPKRESLAGEPVFGADGGVAVKPGKAAVPDAYSILSDMNANFSAEDIKLGQAVLAILPRR